MSAVVLDISSDEDVGWGDGGSGLADGGDDGDWLSELLDEVDRERDDSDDVVVLGEVLANPKLRGSKASVRCGDDGDGDDDDCVVLDGDPDKPLSVEKGGEDDSDDLVVVRETGQVACRDYPHARHLCVKYPFDSTPHESHCDQCHCYVCDSLAPCLHWNIAISSTDHCHATEKDEFWKNQRKSVKKIANSSLPMVPVIPQTPFFNDQSPPYQIPSSLPSDNGQMFYIPNTTTCAMMQQKIQPQWVSQPLYNPLKNVARGERTPLGVNASSHGISRTPFKRTRITGVLPTNPTNGFCYNTPRGCNSVQFTRQSLPTGVLGARWTGQRNGGTQVPASYLDPSRANVGGVATNLLPNLSAQQTNLVDGTGNFAPSQLQAISRAHVSGVNRNAYVPQPQVSAYVPQPQVSAYVPQPQVSAYVPQPQGPAYVPQPKGPAFVPQPQMPASVPQYQKPTHVPQPQVSATVPQPQVSATVPQHQTPTYVPQHQVPASVPQHQMPIYVPQHQMPIYVPQHQVPASVPLHQAPPGISGVVPLSPMQLCPLGTTVLSNLADLYGSSNPDLRNSSAYQSQLAFQSQPPPYVSVQGNPTQAPVYSPNDGNVAASLSNDGQSVTAPGDLNQSTKGFEINLDYNYSRSHSNQPLPVDQVQKAVQRDELDSPSAGIPELPTYTSPSSPGYQFDPWIFENDLGFNGFGNPGMDVVLDDGIFDL